MKKKILITGINGLIGYNLLNKIYDTKTTIYAVDKYPLKKNLKKFKIKFFKLNIYEKSFLKKFENKKIDIIYHLAAFASPAKAEKEIEETYLSNILGTINLVNLCKRNKLKTKLIFASAGAIYTNIPKYLPIDEKHPINPYESIYAGSKRICENIIQDEINSKSLNAIYFRFFNTFGPGQDKGYIIPSLINQAKKGLINLQNGKVIRDFNYIDNLTDLLEKSSKSKFIGGPINAASGEAISTLKLAKIIANNFNAKVKIHNKKTFGPKKQIPSIKMAKKIFNWKPSINLETGIKKVIEYSIN